MGAFGTIVSEGCIEVDEFTSLAELESGVEVLVVDGVVSWIEPALISVTGACVALAADPGSSLGSLRSGGTPESVVVLTSCESWIGDLLVSATGTCMVVDSTRGSLLSEAGLESESGPELVEAASWVEMVVVTVSAVVGVTVAAVELCSTTALVLEST